MPTRRTTHCVTALALSRDASGEYCVSSLPEGISIRTVTARAYHCPGIAALNVYDHLFV